MSGVAEPPVVFLGPSLALADAQRILPSAVFRPPVAQGDVYSLLGPDQPDAIGIIDGVFYQDLPVWHKEIIAALEQGVAVYGASSMGALRAAECAPFGMVGVGAIFGQYASGELIDDDEVAVAHDGPEDGWRPRTEPMVNLRATMRRAVADGRLGAAAADRALKVAKRIWFADRTRAALLHELRAAGIPAGEVKLCAKALDEAYVDQKRLDTESLLRMLRDRSPGQDRAETTLIPSHVFVAFKERDRKVTHQDVTLRLEEIARHAALHEPGFAELRDRVLDRLLVDELAWVWGIKVTDEQVAEETRRLRARLGLPDDDSLRRWLAANDVDTDWLARHARRDALARRLRDWLQNRQGKQLLVTPILDELRRSGHYERAAKAAAAAARLRAVISPTLGWSGEPADEEDHERPEVRMRELLRDHIHATAWRPDVPAARFAEEAGFADVRDLLDELVIAREIRTRARERLQLLETLFEPDDERP
jgi:hypothetical protein